MKTRRTFLGLVASATATALALSSPSAAETLKIGIVSATTGPLAAPGKFQLNGFKLAAEEVNAKGGVAVGGKTYKLAVKYYDDESSPARGAELVDRLIKQDGIQFILGPYSSGLTKAIAPVTEQLKTPMVEANGAARSLFTNGWKYIFATLSTADQYLASVIDLAAENTEALGKKKPSDIRVAVIVENDPFSKDIRAGVVEQMKKYGMKLVVDDLMPRDLSDISPSLTKVKALKPDVLVTSGHTKGAVTAARQIGEMKVDTPIVAMTQCDSGKIIEKFGGNVEGFLCPTQWAPTLTYSGKVFGKAQNFHDEFVAKYKEAPPYQAAESAAAVIVYADAIQRAGKLDKEAVREALTKTDLATFYGQIKFDETGKNIAKPMALYQIQNGKLVVVAPSKFAAAKAKLPRQPMN